MRRMFILVMALTLVGCASTDEWRSKDTKRQLLVTTAILFDGWSSRNIGLETGTVENGYVAKSVLGAHPSSTEFTIYFTTLAIGYYFISRALPHKWRPYYQLVTFAEHTYAAAGNCRIGLCSD